MTLEVKKPVKPEEPYELLGKALRVKVPEKKSEEASK